MIERERIDALEKRMSAIESQLQKLPDEIVSRIVEIHRQYENLCAERACLAVLPRTSKMKYAPGSKGFFEHIEVQGVEAKIVDALPSCVRVILIVDEKTDPENIQREYLDRCSKMPITQQLVVSVAKLCL